MTLTLASPVQVDGIVGLDYAPPTGSGANPLRDAAGNEVAGMQGRSIANPTRHGPPTRLRAVPGDRVVRLIWDDPADGDPLGGYEVRRAEGAFVPENTPWIGGQDLASTRTSVLALELRNDRSYSFEVRALDSQSRPGATATVSATPALISCNAPDLGERREVWSGTVDVERLFGGSTERNFGLGSTSAGYFEYLPGFVYGSLSPGGSFAIRSVSYTIEELYSQVESSGTTSPLRLTLSSRLADALRAALKLHWCGESAGLLLPEAASSGRTLYHGTNGEPPDWSLRHGTLAVALSLPANSDATGTPEILGITTVARP